MDWIQLVAGILGIVASFMTIHSLLLPRLRRKRNQTLLEELKFYTIEEVEWSTQWYVESDCQEVDPAYGPESHASHPLRRNIFSTVDEMLDNPAEYKYILLLGDTGIGKTSFILNYYARFLQSSKRFSLRIVPLGRKDADDVIRGIANRTETVLFLDALDEDSRAIGKIQQRVFDLCELTQDFRNVLITSRTQFFPRAIEEPKETGVIKIRLLRMGENGIYTFTKRYFTPFNKTQIAKFLLRRYGLLRWLKMWKAARMIQKIPQLTARPMILSYIDDVLASENDYSFLFQLYETIVQAWLEREVGKLGINDAKPLRAFCDHLAIALYQQQQASGNEWLPYEAVQSLADRFKIRIKTWKLTGRTLLNRDSEDNFKFAHRSIMEYLFVRFLLFEPVDTQTGAALAKLSWTNQMGRFFVELLNFYKKNFSVLAQKVGIEFCRLRSQPDVLSDDDVGTMLQQRGFFDKKKNGVAGCIKHNYIAVALENQKYVFDLSTGLTWQQGGSLDTMIFEKADDYIKEINKKKYSGYSDWRLPTLEEAMSLMEPKKRDGQYIDPVFDATQLRIWTVDKTTAGHVWRVYFALGFCSFDFLDSAKRYVRAVRS